MDTNQSQGRPDSGANRNAGASMNGSTSNSASAKSSGNAKSSLRSDLERLKSDLDALMGHASTLSDDELQQGYDKIMARFGSMRFALKNAGAQASQQFSQRVDQTTELVKDRPLQAIGVAAGIGMLLGLLIGD